MRVLVACEFSGRVRDAFRALGHNAWSVDLLPSEGDPTYHKQRDILDVLDESHDYWDLMIAFPPCTHLAVSGARYFAQKRADGRQQGAIEFFMALVNSGVKRIVLENPVGIMSTLHRPPDQIIQPWMFGEPESKATCLWLVNAPPLTPTMVLPKPESGRWANQTPSGQNKLGPSPTRAQDRGRTYLGIASAMAQQWGKLNAA